MKARGDPAGPLPDQECVQRQYDQDEELTPGHRTNRKETQTNREPKSGTQDKGVKEYRTLPRQLPFQAVDLAESKEGKDAPHQGGDAKRNEEGVMVGKSEYSQPGQQGTSNHQDLVGEMASSQPSEGKGSAERPTQVAQGEKEPRAQKDTYEDPYRQ